MRLHTFVLGWTLLAVNSPARAAGSMVPLATRPPCQGKRSSERGGHFQGTLLSGMRSTIDENSTNNRGPTESVVGSVSLGDARLKGGALTQLRLVGGHLESSSRAAPELVGMVLESRASDGQRTEVAICGSEPVADKPDQVWYQIEFWNTKTSAWENPCISANEFDQPGETEASLSMAMAVPGVWDAQGARHEQPGSFTFSCHSGVIAKCIEWGYVPWATQKGHSLTQLHQACTRMARADYCGNGNSHTLDRTNIDVYDTLSIQNRSSDTNPQNGDRFGGVWDTDGATCVANARTGEDLNRLLQSDCPGRFISSTKDLGMGDLCKMERKDADPRQAQLHNWDLSPARHTHNP